MDVSDSAILLMEAMMRADRQGPRGRDHGCILVVQKEPMQATAAAHRLATVLGLVTVVLDADRTNLNDLSEQSPLRDRAMFASTSERMHVFVVRGVASMMLDPRMMQLRILIGPRSELLLVVDDAAEPSPGWTLCDLRT